MSAAASDYDEWADMDGGEDGLGSDTKTLSTERVWGAKSIPLRGDYAFTRSIANIPPRPSPPKIMASYIDLNNYARHPSSIESSVLAFGSGLTTRTGKNRQKTVESINDPVTPQSKIAVTYKVGGYKLWDIRAKVPPEMQICPLGDKVCFNIKENEIVFTSRELSRGDSRVRTNIHYADTYAFSTLNGLPVGMTLEIAGVSEGDVDIRPDAAYNAQTFTVQKRGTRSFKHTGRHRITTGSWIGVSPVPYAIEVEGPTMINGRPGPTRVLPAILEKGQPESKFRANLFEFNHAAISCQVEDMARSIDHAILNELLASMVTGAAPVLPNALLAKLYTTGMETIKAKLSAAGHNETYQPIELYARWHALDQALKSVMMMLIATPVAPANYNDLRTKAIEFATEIRSAEFLYYHLEETAELYHIPTLKENNSALWVMASGPIGAAVDAAEISVKLLVLQQVIGINARIALGQQHDWAKRLILGLATTSGNPGEDLDAILGPGL